jgi:hypothetical protein
MRKSASSQGRMAPVAGKSIRYRNAARNLSPCEKLITRDAFAPGQRGVARLEIGACPFEIVVGEMDHALDCPGEGSVN